MLLKLRGQTSETTKGKYINIDDIALVNMNDDNNDLVISTSSCEVKYHFDEDANYNSACSIIATELGGIIGFDDADSVQIRFK